MSTGVILLSFGEPATPAPDTVTDYLTRIFLANASIDNTNPENRAERARTLAERRAHGLIAEYSAIDGSPLNKQVERRATSLQAELRKRGFDTRVYTGFQYIEPFISDAVSAAKNDGHNQLVALPLYPLCGPSTTLNALQELQMTLDELNWNIPKKELTGWHRHPLYNRIRADNLKQYATTNNLDLESPDTTLLFSAHGTPQYYLEQGSNYTKYVKEYAESQAALQGLDRFELGYQNHENREIDWTEPTVESLISHLETSNVVVEPISFIHEQSETLSELDIDLRTDAEENNLRFHRVPIPHDDNRFDQLFADLIEPFLANITPEYYNLKPCHCRPEPTTYCFNAPVGQDRSTTEALSVQSE